MPHIFRNFFIGLSVVVALAVVSSTAMAQTEAPVDEIGEDIGEIENIEDYDLVYGAVKEIKADGVVISQFDEETEADADVAYAIDAETTFDGIENLSELQAGEEVEVMFQDIEGRKVVRLLTRIADIYLDEEYDIPASLEAPLPEEQVIQSEEGVL